MEAALWEEERTAVISALRATPVIVAALLRGTTEAELSRVVPDHTWSTRQVVAHLAAVEKRLFERTCRMRETDNPALSSKAGEHDPTLALPAGMSLFASRRRMHTDYLEALTQTEWEREGHHARVGPMSILAQARMIVMHDVEHLAQIAAVVDPRAAS